MAAFSSDIIPGDLPPPPGQAPNEPDTKKLLNYVDFNIRRNIEPYFLNFGHLQQFNLAQIQQDIAQWKAEVKVKPAPCRKDMDGLKRLLHEYATAIRDYEYMKQLAKLDEDERTERLRDLNDYFKPVTDPYNSGVYLRLEDKEGSDDELRRWLKNTLPRKLTYSKEERMNRKLEFARHEPPLRISGFVDRLAQFILAFIGGASLIVPMLIMSFHASKTKSLVTVSFAVLLFSFVLSMALKLQNDDVLAATAAYAAVLVVFVGTST